MSKTWFSIKLRVYCSFYCICYCVIFIAFYSSVISCGKTFQERMSLIMYVAKGMRDECRLKNAAEKFHILFIILKNKKASVNNSLKVEYKQVMPFVTFNFIPRF